MPFFRTDDQMHGHPKARRAGLAALGLWDMAGSHSMAYKTDGFVPAWFVASWRGGVRAAETLVTVGLWEVAERDGEAGFQFHDWHDYQPSADEIERDRERARERQREYSHPARVLKLHDAGAGLVDPCEVHAWDDLILDGEIAVCRCKRDGR